MLLEEAHVQIFSEFEGDGTHHADLREAVFAVEAQRAFVVGRDDGNDIFDAALAAKALDLRIELLPDAAAAAGAAVSMTRGSRPSRAEMAKALDLPGMPMRSL